MLRAMHSKVKHSMVKNLNTQSRFLVKKIIISTVKARTLCSGQTIETKKMWLDLKDSIMEMSLTEKGRESSNSTYIEDREAFDIEITGQLT